MRNVAFLLIFLTGLLAAPAVAEDFLCPKPAKLPHSLNLSATGEQNQKQIEQLQAYLTNIKLISSRYQSSTRYRQQNILALCLIDHLSTLPDSKALQGPLTPADQATWNLFADEVRAALNQLNPRFIRAEAIRMRFVNNWLQTVPQQPNVTVSSR